MAYNLQPLITIVEGILDPDQPRWIVDENNPQLQSLLDKVTSLQQILDEFSFTKLDCQIREVAHQAEDILESHMVHHMLTGSNCVRFTLSTPDLQQVTRDLDSVIEQVKKLVEMEDDKMPRELDSAMKQLKHVEMEDKKMPSISSSSSKSAVVGIDADLMQLKDQLTGMEKKREIVPIVDYNNGSRIVITTRESDVANYADSSRSQHQENTSEEEENTSEEEVNTRGEEWELAEEDVFCSLQFLNLECLNLVRWIADETNFPRLRHLRLYCCCNLEEIPSAIGEIPTLQLIDLEECTKSTVASAERIVEEQSENGNYDLKLRITDTLVW
ncbi:hypothetical protein AAHA92_03986 [Salvia divinorum]|uniref:Rx N-terminal domain-containing protein n=1 Tax=Salvia divinorum TaxID=28513 RepID=A0ABD1I189_SALDI